MTLVSCAQWPAVRAAGGPGQAQAGILPSCSRQGKRPAGQGPGSSLFSGLTSHSRTASPAPGPYPDNPPGHSEATPATHPAATPARDRPHQPGIFTLCGRPPSWRPLHTLARIRGHRILPAASVEVETLWPAPPPTTDRQCELSRLMTTLPVFCPVSTYR